MRRVAVTGIGVVSPLGIGAGAFWDGLLSGRCALGPVRRWDAGGFACQIAGEVPEYKMGDFVPKHYRKATKVMARDIELAVIAASEAFASAKLASKADGDDPSFDPARFGCNIGAGLINADLDELAGAMDVARGENGELDLEAWGREGMQRLTPLWLLKYLPNMLACHVTIVHGLMGPSNTITCADASSHLAIGEAFRTIQRGDADLAVCGGAESKVNPMGFTRHQLLGRLNESANDAPDTAVQPFDPAAAGAVHGEGGGLLILEELDHARARGATVYAEVVGFAASQDAYATIKADPTGHSYAAAARNALRDADLSPGDVDLLVPHGTGHAPSDAAELAGLRGVFGDDLARPAAATVKGQTGNLHAGSGQDVAAAVLALHHGTVPPAVNAGNVGLNVSPQKRDADLTVALTSVASLGGQNAALVFRKA